MLFARFLMDCVVGQPANVGQQLYQIKRYLQIGLVYYQDDTTAEVLVVVDLTDAILSLGLLCLLAESLLVISSSVYQCVLSAHNTEIPVRYTSHDQRVALGQPITVKLTCSHNEQQQHSSQLNWRAVAQHLWTHSANLGNGNGNTQYGKTSFIQVLNDEKQTNHSLSLIFVVSIINHGLY